MFAVFCFVLFFCIQAESATFYQVYFSVSIHTCVHMVIHLHVYLYCTRAKYMYIMFDNLATSAEVLLDITACVSGDDYCASN